MRKIGLLLLLLTVPAACSEVTVSPSAAEDEDDDAGSGPGDWTLGDGDGPGDAVVQISEPVDLTITPEGVIFLAGNFSVAGQTDKVCSVERVSADGQYLGLTSFETSPSGARLGSAAAVEVSPSGEVLLLCIGTKSGASDSAWVGWLASDGSLIAEAEVPDVLPYGLSITSDQMDAVLFGASVSTGLPYYQHVSTTGPTGTPLALPDDMAGRTGHFYSADHHPDGWTVALAVVDGVSEPKLLRVDDDTPTILGAACGYHVAVAPDGTIYTTDDISTTRSICRHTESGGAWSTETWPVELTPGKLGGFADLDVDDQGRVVVVGTSADLGFARGYESGQLVWSDDLVSPAPGGTAAGLAIATHDDRVVYVGRASPSAPSQPAATVLRSLRP